MRLEKVMWPNKYMLMTVGLWPSMHSNTGLGRRLFANFHVLFVLIAMISFFVAQFLTVVANWGNINILGDYGALAVVHFLVTLKILYYFFRQRSFASIYQHIKDFWEISDDPQERRLYERLANIAKIVTITSFLSGIADLSSFEVAALIKSMKNRLVANESLRHRPLPMELYYGFDTQATPSYEIIFVWQSICMFYAICSIIGCDTTMMVFIVHVTGQFKLINSRFRDIGWKISNRDNDQSLRTEIGKCIAQHQRTIRVTKELSAFVSPIIFCQIMSSGLEICLAGYAVIEGENSGAELIKFLTLFVSLMIQLVVWCGPAELLIQESTAIAETIYYDIPWFKLTTSQQRDLGFVMMRAQKACHISAMYQIMSIRRLTEVFNAAGSYMALLKSMKK